MNTGSTMMVWKVVFFYFLAVAFGSASAFVGPGRSPHHHHGTVNIMFRRQQKSGGVGGESSSLSSLSLGRLDPSETAMVFIEYQNEFTTPGGKLHDAVKEVMEATNMLSNSRRVMEAARNAGCTIIHCPISFEPGHHEISNNPYGILAGVKQGGAFTNGEWGAEFSDMMKPAPGDLIVKGKSGLCGFASTNLEFLLRQANAKNMVLAGFLTNCCVESTMRTGYEKGLKVYTLQDCVAATSLEAQDATLKNNFGMFSIPTTSDEIVNALSSATTTAVST